MAHVSVANVVASATEDSWVQSYSAGTLIALVALHTTKEKSESNLPTIGRSIIKSLEAEYYTLPTKNLSSIKKAVETAYQEKGDTIASLLVASVVQNVLYIYIIGQGEIFLKRGNKFGPLLTQKEHTTVILTGSGFLEMDDKVVMTTVPFLGIISPKELESALSHQVAEDAVEQLSPKIHQQEVGDAGAVIFTYHDNIAVAETTPPTQEEKENKPQEIPVVLQKESHLPAGRQEKQFLSHRQKLFATIAMALVILLGMSIFFSIQKQQQKSRLALFASLYTQAQKKYDEGQGLADLNKNLAKDDFTQAKAILISAQPKFSKDSSEEKQIQDLLQKVDQGLQATSEVNASTPQIVDDAQSPLLFFAKKQNTAFITQDDKNFYTGDVTGISQTTKTGGKTIVIIKNNSDWTSLGGFDTYLGNMYVVDKKSGILKYVPAGSGFTKSNYLASSTSVGVSKVTSLTIDGSIWLVNSDGSILKFTRGKQDTLNISGLDTPLKQPTQIKTAADMTNVYVLDNGNGRIVVFNKTGAYVAQYQADILKSATNMDVQETQKKIYVLGAGKIYQINLK